MARLEQKGFVEGFGDPADRRVKLVRITAAGEACCRQAERNMEQTETNLLSGLTETERSIFLTLLKNHENARSLGDTVRQILGQEYKILAKCSNPAQTEVSPVQTLLQKAKDSNLETAVE